MSWFGKTSSKVVESKSEMESHGIIFETIKFHRDRKEYELLIHLPGCAKDLIKLTYERSSGVLKLQGKQKIDFVHRFPIPIDCLATGIYGRFRGEVLHIIMPTSRQEGDQPSLCDRKSTEQVGEDRENLPASVPESLPSHQKSTDELTGGGGKDRGKSPASVLEPSSSDQKSTEKLTERGKDHDELSARVLSSLAQSDQETAEKLRQRDNELFPEISERQPSVRKPSTTVKELTENYQKNISKTSSAPSTPRTAAPAPWNRSRKEEGKDQVASSDQKNAERGDLQPENSVVQNEKKLRKGDSRCVQITLDEQREIKPELSKSDHKDAKKDGNEGSAKMEKMLDASKAKEEAKKERIVDESKAKEEAKKERIVDESKAKDDKREKKKPSVKGKGTLDVVVARVKEMGKTALEAAKKEENRAMVIAGAAAVLALFVIGASLRKKPKK